MQQVKKIKFNHGRDANRSLTRKLVGNLIKFGHVKTSLPRAKVLKSTIDRLVGRAKERKESHKNILLKALSDRVLVEKLFTDVAPQYSDRVSGFVRIVKGGVRQGDGTKLARVEWVEGKVGPEITVETKVETQSETEKKKVTARKKTVKKADK